jgi:hypothetical protein
MHVGIGLNIYNSVYKIIKNELLHFVSDFTIMLIKFTSVIMGSFLRDYSSNYFIYFVSKVEKKEI